MLKKLNILTLSVGLNVLFVIAAMVVGFRSISQPFTPPVEMHPAVGKGMSTNLMTQMRAAGMAEGAARAAARAVIWSSYQAKLHEIIQKHRAEGKPYWRAKIGDTNNAMSYAERAALRTLSAEARGKELAMLGSIDDNNIAQATDRYSYLPILKASQLADLEQDYADMRAQLLNGNNGLHTEADKKALQLLSENHKNDLSALLSPEELQSYNLRESSTANIVRKQFAQFEGTEDEYKKVFAAQQQYDQLKGTTDGDTAWKNLANGFDTLANPSGQAANLPDLNASIQSALGDERYAEFVKSQQLDYQTLEAAATRYNLTPDVVDQVYSARQSALAQATDIANDQSLTVDQKHQALSDLVTQTQAVITQTMGQEAATNYLSSAMDWLNLMNQGIISTFDANGIQTIKTLPRKGN